MSEMNYRVGASCVMKIYRGDLTRTKVDGIVNAANERMLGGGGVDGAIHRAAGRRLVTECEKFPAVDGVRCPTGESRTTIGCELPSKFVIHTVGPVYVSAEESSPLLASCYKTSLAEAGAKDMNTVAFPAISCGVYGYPHGEAGEVAVQACKDFCPQSVKEIHFVLFEVEAYDAWNEAATKILGPCLNPAPEQAPAEQAPAEQQSAEPAAAEPAAAEPAPSEPSPSEPASAEPAPAEPAPEQTLKRKSPEQSPPAPQ